jgi:hypothetical protein
MDNLRRYLQAVNRQVPRTPPGSQQQYRICGELFQNLVNEDLPAIKVALIELDFTAMDNDALTTSLIQWSTMFRDIGALVALIGRVLSIPQRPHMQIIVNLQEIQLSVGGVISRAIARLAILNQRTVPELDVDSLFK